MNSAGRASYVERNQWMIDESDFVVMYYDGLRNTYQHNGTSLVYGYAKQQGKEVLMI